MSTLDEIAARDARIKTFVVEVRVSGEFMRDDQSMATALAHDLLRDRATDPLVGPRGGRYVAIEEVRDIRGGQTTRDFALNQWTFVGRVNARYQRPHPARLTEGSDRT